MTEPTEARAHLMEVANRNFLNDEIYDALIELDSEAFEVGDVTLWNEGWDYRRLMRRITEEENNA